MTMFLVLDLQRPQAVMAPGQVLFHRFYCKKSFTRFSVKRVAASCVWLASKLEESPRKAKHIIIVFHRVECRRENLPIEHLDVFSKKYSELKHDLMRTERHLLKEMGFICHVEHPHKFISNYLATLGNPEELRQEAWNLANDSLRTTLCVRFKSEVVACGVVYAAACRFQIPLPENPPWWLVFDADKNAIDEVCRVLAHLYTLPKAQYIPVNKDTDSFTSISKTPDAQVHVPEESLPGTGEDNNGSKAGEDNLDGASMKEAKIKLALDKLKESKKNDDDPKSGHADADFREASAVKSTTGKTWESERERSKVKDWDSRGRDSDRESRGRDFERDREHERDLERNREKHKEQSHRSKDKGSDRGEYHGSHSSRDKERNRHYQYT